MVRVDGKFQFVTSENFEEYLKALGQLEVAGNFASSQPIVEIKSHDGDRYTITVDSNGKIASSTFKLDEYYDESLPSYGATLKSITRKEDNKFVTETQLGDNKSIRVYEFTETGMTVHLSEIKHGVKASRTYKRL